MHTYSLYYFQKAAYLKPYDPRMWCAMAETYERLNRTQDAIKCYLRAEGNQDREGIAVHKLARLYSSLGDRTQAVLYFQKVLQRQDVETNGETQDSVDALLYLSEHYKNTGKYSQV